ncbi:MAG: AAA family ATPase [Polyangiaceae bacterium]|nr:AAA family ATPase [Polyangiaceae bacterium]
MIESRTHAAAVLPARANDLVLWLGDYDVGETLHEGRDVLVVRARHRSSGEHVIIKLPRSESPTARTIGRMMHEYRILTKLSAVAGVPKARTLEHHGGTAALVLYDLGLRPLSAVLGERGRLPIDAALHIALCLCQVLEGVHLAGVVHKDIKPHNILVDDGCTQVVLADFGIASELEHDAAPAIIPESLEGTLAYISPEQTGRTARAVDCRTDLYSLGVVLFEMLAGRRPFEAEDPLALVYAHLATPAPAVAEAAPGLPRVVSAIVAKLLSKELEWRYQTAHGAAKDLERALSEWIDHGTVEAFELGTRDFSPVLQIPDILVGRDNECRELNRAFERTARGAVELLLVGGPSGVGKTALVRSVYRHIAKAGRGSLLSGKYDRLRRAVPYTAIAQAFSCLVNNVAASPKAVFERWRLQFDEALGKNARIIADLIPALEWLMGPLPPVPAVPTEMAYNRLKLSFISFVRAVTDMSPPLVLFLDDMQWVDPASIELLRFLLTDVARKHLLVIAAYRDNEVTAEHPLRGLIDAATEAGVSTPNVSVQPLSAASVEAWLALTLSAEPDRVSVLAESLYRKTRGNPFYLGQLVMELHRQKRLTRNAEDGTWQWDPGVVEVADASANITELMRKKVATLPSSTRELLGQAACAGHSFSIGELAILSGMTRDEVATQLWPALVAELLVPSDSQYGETRTLVDPRGTRELEARYRFLHDRVQEAFYEEVAPEQRARTHLSIGRRLQNAFELEGGAPEKLLELVRQLNLGAPALEGTEERDQLAMLNLRAARVAKQNGSYKLQASLVEQGQRLLGERAWTAEPDLSADLALERLEADYMLRRWDDIQRGSRSLLARPLRPSARLAAEEVRVRACLGSGRYNDGARFGVAALRERGIVYPDTDDERIASTLELFVECDRWLDEHPDAFNQMPSDDSPELAISDALEAELASCAAIGGQAPVGSIAVVRNVKRMMRRGTLSKVSPFILAALAHVRSSYLREYGGGVRWARAAEDVASRLGSHYLAECASIRGMYTAYEAPVKQARVHYRAAVRAALASGSFQGVSWGLAFELYFVDLWSGQPLDEVAEREANRREVMLRAGDAFGMHHFKLAGSVIEFLRSPDNAEPDPNSDWLAAGSRYFLSIGDSIVTEQARIQEAQLCLAFGMYERALERAEEAERFRPAIYGPPPATDIPLWRGLSAAKCWSTEQPVRRRESLVAIVDDAIGLFRYFTGRCAENFGMKLRLLEAERQRIDGRTDDALLSYDDAIDQARQQGFLHIEGLCARFCADFHLAAGRNRLAGEYLRHACDAYGRWGARALIGHLRIAYPNILGSAASLTPRIPFRAADAGITASATESDEGASGAALDVDTFVRAAQTLAGELDPGRVLVRLMHLVEENAGAERAVLLVREQERLDVVARLTGTEVTSLTEPLSAAHPVAHSVVQFVLRSQEPVLLRDARADSRFADDGHVETTAVRSILAVPLVHQSRTSGVLYLEHDTPHAFPEARVTLVTAIAGQAAIALEHAKLHAGLAARTEQLDKEVRERRHAEMEERASHARLRAVLDNMVDAVFACDRAGTIKLVNRAAMTLMGVRREEDAMASSYEVAQLLHVRHVDGRPFTAGDLPLERALTYGETSSGVEVVGRDACGERDKFLRVSTAPIRDDEGPVMGAVAVVSDITESVELERLKDQFIRVAAHELKTPVAIVKGYGELLGRAVSALPEEQRRMVEAMSRGADRIHHVVDDLLYLSQLQLGKLPLVPEPIDLVELVREAALRAEPREPRRVRLRSSVDALSMHADRELLQRAIFALIDNALRYSPKGGDVEIEIRRRDGRTVLLSIRDRGVGIPQDRQSRIFAPFFRAHTDTQHDFGGMGVGLHIARAVVVRHGGDIWFESKEGVGTTFYVTLPEVEEER